jgi:hypothetical protein
MNIGSAMRTRQLSTQYAWMCLMPRWERSVRIEDVMRAR